MYYYRIYTVDFSSYAKQCLVGEVQMQLLEDSSLTAGPAGDAGGYEKAEIQFTTGWMM